jgi:uncharacterized protein (DUF58 family)
VCWTPSQRRESAPTFDCPLARRVKPAKVAQVFDPRSVSPAVSPSERLSAGAHPAQAGGEAVRKGVPPEILRQVKLIELRTRGLVNSVFTGEYRSVFKGQGMEFSEVREYQPGDEVRIIDWNVTARMGRPFVKRYVEERELTVMLAVDLSGSERFGTVNRFKSELASELAAVLAMSAVRNNDRVGVVLFTDRIEYVVPPRKDASTCCESCAISSRSSPPEREPPRRRNRSPRADAEAEGDHLPHLRFRCREHRALAEDSRSAP